MLMFTDTKRRPAAGYSIIELLVVLAFLGITCVIGASVWIKTREQTECTQAARIIKSFLLEARMLSVYKVQDHFVVFDPATRTLSLYADTASPIGVYTTADTRLRREALPTRAALALPATPSPLASPLDGGTISSAWGIALPDTSGAWGSNLRGVRAIPTGQIQTVEATPQNITAGTIVLSDNQGNAVAVGVRGQMGSIRSFKLVNSIWKEI
jgi:type II secretory pathway pseudopilin PulG